MGKVFLFLAEGFEEIEAVSIIDVLRRADINVQVVSISRELEVTGSHGIIVKADVLFEDVNHENAEMLILPGGMPGSENLSAHEGVQKMILKLNEENKPLGAICAAPMVFGKLGILNNRVVTCYPGFEKYLEGANITGFPVQNSGNIITGKGAGVAIHFALEIVKKLKGEELAVSLKEKLIVP